jgi:hypothetical protein
MLIELDFSQEKINDIGRNLSDVDLELKEMHDKVWAEELGNGTAWIRERQGFYLSYMLDNSLELYANVTIIRQYDSFIYPYTSFTEAWKNGMDYKSNYGVCDNVEQVMAKYPELETSDRKFVVILTPIIKATQPSQGGWRWHKWGEYIGTQEPQCEYIYNEPIIEEVLLFHIYEVEETV